MMEVEEREGICEVNVLIHRRYRCYLSDTETENLYRLDEGPEIGVVSVSLSVDILIPPQHVSCCLQGRIGRTGVQDSASTQGSVGG